MAENCGNLPTAVACADGAIFPKAGPLARPDFFWTVKNL